MHCTITKSYEICTFLFLKRITFTRKLIDISKRHEVGMEYLKAFCYYKVSITQNRDNDVKLVNLFVCGLLLNGNCLANYSGCLVSNPTCAGV